MKDSEEVPDRPRIRSTMTQPRGKDWATAFIEKLPDDVTFTEICYMITLNRMIEESIRSAEEGRWVSHEEVKALIESWRESPPRLRTVKEQFRDFLEELPDDATWNDVAYEVFENKERSDSYRGLRHWGPVVSREEAEQRFPDVDPYHVSRARRTYTAAIRKDGEVWSGWVENLPGANAQGADIEELRQNLEEAAMLVIEQAQAQTAEDLEGAELWLREEMQVVVEVAHTFGDARKSEDSEPEEKRELSDSSGTEGGPFSDVEPPTTDDSGLLRLLVGFCGLEIELSRIGGLIALVVLRRPDGRRVILMQRVFRDGVCMLEDPSDEELLRAKEDENLMYRLWNSPRAVYMTVLVY